MLVKYTIRRIVDKSSKRPEYYYKYLLTQRIIDYNKQRCAVAYSDRVCHYEEEDRRIRIDRHNITYWFKPTINEKKKRIYVLFKITYIDDNSYTTILLDDKMVVFSIEKEHKIKCCSLKTKQATTNNKNKYKTKINTSEIKYVILIDKYKTEISEYYCHA